ncbi:outer membrane beta-barrel protein [Bradyrhizobium sp. DOA9]|uniref:outer membrane beta-barrel protein n=1 Tax=Bradyrhizobium sp. DOA9 TaxID=1126627 RepID=UPI00049992D8|nr:outer membrane beta-barrel protein [Bradyrhizobium sp. DOA9]GAJ37830.1 31 kDa outer-membrane immunogenic protein precursor [Bradyrhizobium sp. DOA9]
MQPIMMRRFPIVVATTIATSFPALPADMAVKSRPVAYSTAYDWTGFYAGVNAGGAWGAYDPRTSATVSSVFAVSPFNGAGAQKISPAAFSAGEQTGYNWQVGQFVLGIEAGLDYLHLNGTANSGAVPSMHNPATQFVISSYAHSDWLFTLRPRAGVAVNEWLFYLTGGLALTNIKGDLLVTGTARRKNGLASIGSESASIDQDKLGYAVGAGVEWGVSDRLSLKAEYLYASFGRVVASQTSSNFALQQFTQSEALSAALVRLGLNYRFGDTTPWSGTNAVTEKAAGTFSNLELEAGTRAWFSSGRVGAPQPLFDRKGTRLMSRLIFSGLDGASGETFARIDHTNGFFAKGFLGAGGITNGSLNDEDFLSTTRGYSNTLSSAKGHIGYGVVDIGYSMLRTLTAKLGPFVGYNYYAEDINTYGCRQLAHSGLCADDSTSFLGIAQDGHYDAVRIGLNSQFVLADRLKLTSEAAYLPWINFIGQDDHNARQLLLPEEASKGTGMMLESILGYDVSHAWSVGIGARYWAYNMKNGSTTFNNLSLASRFVDVPPTRTTSERYGVFVQSSYKWGDAVPAASSTIPVKAQAAAMNWTSIYVGGHLGGGVSRDSWSDPFGLTLTGTGGTNAAGFGDTIRATGPVGGLQIGANRQIGNWVIGLEGSLSATDLRGENTCFSGLGGINCQHVTDAIGTLTGRLGWAWDQSLIYAKAGGAWAHSTYNLLGNTGALSLGIGSASSTRSGWVAGAGLEYALTNGWTTFVEYDHLGFDAATIAWPTVAVINAQTISVGQSVDLFKLGVNYKFDWAKSGDAAR